MSRCIVCRPYMMYTTMRQQKYVNILRSYTLLYAFKRQSYNRQLRTERQLGLHTMLQNVNQNIKSSMSSGSVITFANQRIRSGFYSAPQCSHCKRCTSYGNSVCLSVRLSHAAIVSKRRHVPRCSMHCQIAKCV